MNNNKSLLFFVFSEGFIVLTLQILVFVVLTPFWGQTFSFWVLSLVMSMTGLSLGYILAPRLIGLTKNGALGFLYKLIFYALTYVAVIYAFNQGILEVFLGLFENPVVGSTVSLFLFFFIPTVMLGMVPIVFIQYLKEDSEKGEGELSGTVFSMSSVGGIIGVLLVAHLLLPSIGAKGVIILVMLFLLLLFLFVQRLSGKKNLRVAAIVIIVFASIITLGNAKVKKGDIVDGIEVVEVKDGVLGRLAVVNNHKHKRRYLLVNNNIQSMVHFSGRSLNPYVYSLAMYASYFEKNSDMLVAGLGCGSLPYELGQMGYEVDVVDIDDRLDELVQEYFLKSRNAYNFIHSDVRRYVHNCSKKYKCVFLDISHGENVPVNVYTTEGLKQCSDVLEDDGILLIHFLSAQDKEGEYTLGSLLKTLESSGLNYKIMNFLNRKTLFDFDDQNGSPEGFIIAASKDDVKIHEQELVVDPSLLKALVPVKDSLYLEHDFKGVGEVLTDNKSSLEYHHSVVANKYRKLSMEELKSDFGNAE